MTDDLCKCADCGYIGQFKEERALGVGLCICPVCGSAAAYETALCECGERYAVGMPFDGDNLSYDACEKCCEKALAEFKDFIEQMKKRHSKAALEYVDDKMEGEWLFK